MDHGALGLADSGAVGGCLAAVVDRVDDEVLEGVGDTVEDLLVELDVLAGGDELDVLAGGLGDVAHDAGKCGEDPAHRHHREAHRPVADQRHAPAVPFDQLAQTPDGAGHLVGRADEAVQREGHVGVQRGSVLVGDLPQDSGPACLVGGQGQQGARRLLDPTGAEVGLTDDVQQVVDLGGGDADRIRGLPVGRCVVDLDLLGDVHRGEGRHLARVGAGHGPDQGVDDRLEQRVVDGVVARQRAADAVACGEQQVDVVLADREPAVAQRAEQVLHVVGDVQHALEPEHARRALDGVGVAEQRRHDLARALVVLEREQACLQRREPLLDLRAEGREQLRVVAPCRHGLHVDGPAPFL